jgi:hypothetical protein
VSASGVRKDRGGAYGEGQEQRACVTRIVDRARVSEKELSCSEGLREQALGATGTETSPVRAIYNAIGWFCWAPWEPGDCARGWNCDYASRVSAA